MRANWPLSQAGEPFGIERCLGNDHWERGWLRVLVGKRFCKETLERNEIRCCSQYAITRSPAARSSFRICKTITFCKKKNKNTEELFATRWGVNLFVGWGVQHLTWAFKLEFVPKQVFLGAHTHARTYTCACVYLDAVQQFAHAPEAVSLDVPQSLFLETGNVKVLHFLL